MKRRIEEWSVKKLFESRENISFPDYQREPKLWGLKEKQLLIDSIIIDMDIPKLYFNEIKKGDYEVVDGQQRLWAIWEFIDNEYKCEIDGKNKHFDELSATLREHILSYGLQITIITNASEKDLRELFLRLQLGLLLITGEKLNATVGLMKDFVFKKMVKHPFVKSIAIPERRFAKQTLCAQICINLFSKENINDFSRTRYEDLKYFFKSYEHLQGEELKLFENQCKHILDVLDTINFYFKEKAELLKNRSFILSVYLFIEEMTKTHSKQALELTMPKFVEFAIKLLERLRSEARAGFDRKNEELYIFESFLSNAPGEKYQIKRRHDKLKDFFKYYQKTDKIKGDK